MITNQTSVAYANPQPLKYNIPLTYVGLVIGKGGEKIKELQHQSGATIILSRDILPGASEREATITGTEEQMRAAWQLIDVICKERTQDVISRQNEMKKDVVIPSQKVGLIIGRGGATIKEMKQISGAFIQVSQRDPNNPSPTATITISAKSQQSLDTASKLIEERLKMPPDPPQVRMGPPQVGGRGGPFPPGHDPNAFATYPPVMGAPPPGAYAPYPPQPNYGHYPPQPTYHPDYYGQQQAYPQPDYYGYYQQGYPPQGYPPQAYPPHPYQQQQAQMPYGSGPPPTGHSKNK